MKKCPFCAEEIQDEAIKCKHCGEFLQAFKRMRFEEEKTPWYFRTSFIIFGFCCVGPLALPMIWWHPRLNQPWKVGITFGTLIVSWFLFQMTMVSIHRLAEYYRLIELL